MNDEQKELVKKPKSFIFCITSNLNNAKIKPFLANYDQVIFDVEKCNDNPNPDYFPDVPYCFDLSFFSLNLESKVGNHSLGLYCAENCTTPDGNPAEIEILIITPSLKIDHSNDNPIFESEYNGYAIKLVINKNTKIEYELQFTPILYNSSEALNTKTKTYIKTHFTSIELISIVIDNIFAQFYLNMNNNCDIYIREYRTFLDTLSRIGGLFSPIKLLLELLIMFYSDLEINSEITKNVFSKIKNYEYKPVNIENNPNIINFKISNKNKEIKEIRKKFNINKGEQYFCSFFNFCCSCCNFCKTHRTMKILNLSSDFVKTYLSAENIIYNMILFESYYKNNDEQFNKNLYLNQIEKEIESELIEDEKNEEEKKEKVKNEKIDENNKKEKLMSFSSHE